jgi:hypothetical protein
MSRGKRIMEGQKGKGEKFEESSDHQWGQDTCRQIHGGVKGSGCL